LRLRGEDWGRSGEGGKIGCGWLREKKKSQKGELRRFLLGEGEEKVLLFRVFFFVLSPQMFKINPSFL
jgi:hypothetical protein